MNFTDILKEMQNATSFDLFRLRCAIDLQLEDPARMATIKRQLKVGAEVEYFDPEQNRSIKARIVEVRRTRVSVLNLEDNRKWNLPFYYINLNNVDTAIRPNIAKGLSKQEIQVGETLGFVDNDGQDTYGTVIRLNPKTVSINTADMKWRIPYSLLFKVLDGESADMQGTLLIDP
jgi:hypothetical protein